MRTDPNTRTGMSITGDENLRVLVNIFLQTKFSNFSALFLQVQNNAGKEIRTPKQRTKFGCPDFLPCLVLDLRKKGRKIGEFSSREDIYQNGQKCKNANTGTGTI
jgi:hypothetical protein